MKQTLIITLWKKHLQTKIPNTYHHAIASEIIDCWVRAEGHLNQVNILYARGEIYLFVFIKLNYSPDTQQQNQRLFLLNISNKPQSVIDDNNTIRILYFLFDNKTLRD